jgi:hypothetical protein
MRVIATLATAVTVTAAAAAAVVSAVPAAASPSGAPAGAQCVRMQGLTLADLCVSVQPAAASVHPGGIAAFTVTVSIENGFSTGVTVALSAEPSGEATFTSGCPGGDGSASCSVSSLNLLGSPSSYQLQAQLPAPSGDTSVALTATASVPTLLPWTPPAAGASVAVITPTPTPSPTATKTTPAPATTWPARSTKPAPKQPSPSAGSQSSAPAVTVGAGAGPTLPPIPLPTLAGPANAVVRAGSASGLFPTISATPSPGTSAQGASTREMPAEAAGFQVPLAPAGLIIAILIALGGAGLGGRQLYHRRRDGKG